MQNNDFFASKAIDNRAGVVVIDELAHRLHKKEIKSNPILVGTVQEEVGSRGAKMVAKMISADIAFAIDTGAAHDTEGAIPGVQKLGAGVAIDIADGGALMDPRLVEILFRIAKEKHPYLPLCFTRWGNRCRRTAIFRIRNSDCKHLNSTTLFALNLWIN